MAVSCSIDDQVRNAYYTPAPTQYSPKSGGEISSPKRHGKISESRLPSPLLSDAKKKAWVPGPGAFHSPRYCRLPEGGRMSPAPPRDKVNIDYVYESPGPGAYGAPRDSSWPRPAQGKFSREKRFTFSKGDKLRAQSMPGPGAYNSSSDFNKGDASRARTPTLRGRAKSHFDLVARQREETPGPASYDLPNSVNPNKAQGKVVYTYESATARETQEVLAKHSSNVPGPGSYDVPDFPPSSGAPTLKGRSCGHGMPAPFNYNCGPDLSGKFGGHQNNSIASTRTLRARRDAVPRFTRKAGQLVRSFGGSHRSKSDSFSVFQEGDLKTHVVQSPKAVNPETNNIEWTAGDFPLLRKSGSAPSLLNSSQVVDQSLTETSKFHPALSPQLERTVNTTASCVAWEESFSTHEYAPQNMHICREKLRLVLLAQELEKAAANAVEPLDLNRLKEEAMQCLGGKMRSQLRIDGVANRRHEVITSQTLTALAEEVGLERHKNLGDRPVDSQSDVVGTLRNNTIEFCSDDPIHFESGLDT